MKKKFKDRKGVKVFNSILKGVIKDPLIIVTSPVIGAVAAVKQGVEEIKQENKNDETGGLGQPNYIRWISFFIAVAILIFVLLDAFGVLSPEVSQAVIDALEAADESLPLDTIK